MKDAFTTAYSDLLRNKIEFASTIESILADSKSGQAPSAQVTEVQGMLDIFNAQVTALAKRMAERYDEDAASIKKV